MALTLGATARCQAQTDNFNAGNDSGWSRFNLNTYVTGDASYTFPDDGAGGKAYRINVAAVPIDFVSVVGPARALSYRTDVTYTGRFSMGVDVLAWNNNVDHAFGPFWCAQSVELGMVNGYTCTYDPAAQQFLLSRITSEQRSELTKINNVILDPANHYRFSISSHDGFTFLCQLFTTSDTHMPLWTMIAQDTTYSSGYGALLVFDGSDNANVGTDATFDNYAANVPASNSMGPVVSVQGYQPNARITDLFPIINVSILDRDSGVDTTKVHLWMDGSQVPDNALTITQGLTVAGNPSPIAGAAVSYSITTILPVESKHTNSLIFADNNGVWRTNTWSWISAYPYLKALNSLPASAARDPGLAVRLLHADPTASLPNTIDTAEALLATPPGIPAVFSTNFTAERINFTKDPNVDPDGVFPYDGGFPGINPEDCVNLGMEATAWLNLPQGVCQFGVKSDDGFKLTSGTSLTDTNGTLLGYHSGGTYAETFEFVTESAGLYPFRFVFNQGGGGAYVQFYSVIPTNSAPLLINATNSEAIKAYQSAFAIQVESALTLSAQAFTLDNTAQIDTNTKTITVPESGAQRFFRLRCPGSALRINSVKVTSGNIILTYE